MFTLHLIQTNGELSPAVGEGLSYDREDGAWTCKHAQTARTEAQQYARRANVEVVVVRDDTRPCYVVKPDGSVSPPPGAQVPEREQCRRGGDRACFCSACRAERRDARAAGA